MSRKSRSEPLTYKAAGVDIDAMEEAIRRFKANVESTHGPEVIGGIGHFGGLFRPELRHLEEPVLVAGTDSVGTKLKIAFATGRHDTVGIDLVAMSVNDIICLGARPLFFLDYIGTHKVVPEVIEQIVSGIVEGCRQAGCALIGGEIAELRDLYNEGEYDLVGFAVGLADRRALIDGSAVREGDQLIGLQSSGIHSNGFTLARKVLFEQGELKLDDTFPGTNRTVAEELLEPTRIYVPHIRALLNAEVDVRAIANITGGGLYDNLARVIPDGLGADVYTDSWAPLAVFEVIQQRGNIAFEEMHRTFNMGVGMVVIVARGQQEWAVDIVRRSGCMAWVIGEVVGGCSPENKVMLRE